MRVYDRLKGKVDLSRASVRRALAHGVRIAVNIKPLEMRRTNRKRGKSCQALFSRGDE